MFLCGSSSFVTPRTVACQASLFMGFPRQDYWSGWPFPSPGDLPNVGTEHASPESVGRLFSTEAPGKPSSETYTLLICVKGLFGIWGVGSGGSEMVYAYILRSRIGESQDKHRYTYLCTAFWDKAHIIYASLRQQFVENSVFSVSLLAL